MFKLVTPTPGIHLFHSDSREVLQHLADRQWLADLVVCDPPYGINYAGRGHRPIEGDDDAIAISDWSVAAMTKVLKPDAAMFVCTRDDVSPAWKYAMRANGLRVLANDVTWDKVHASGAGDPLSTFRVREEPIIVAHNGRPLLRPWTDTCGRHFPGEPGKVVARDEGLWRYPVPKDKLSSRHPTPKPPLMFERAILPYTDTGGIVLDPFMGGAPVGVACLYTGRRYIGIEKDAEYFELAVENIRAALVRRSLTERIETELRLAA